jgi:glycosyltransferase involved in cell wall biosynthesis
VLAQRDASVEVVVVDDGSPDAPALERALADVRDRITYITQRNGGPSAARNAGIRASRGALVAFLDSDDAWRPDFLQQQLSLMARWPAADLVYSDAIFVGESRNGGHRCMEFCPSRGDVTYESLVSGRCVVITSSVVARRDALERAGLFDESIRCAEDLDLWLRLVKVGGRIKYQTKVLVERSFNADSLSADDDTMREAHLHVLRKSERDALLTPPQRRAVQNAIAQLVAEFQLEQGKAQLAAGALGPAAEALRAYIAAIPWRSVRRLCKASLVLLGIRVSPHLTLRLVRSRAAIAMSRAA